MCDKFFESVGVSEDILFAGEGSVNIIHQLGEKVEGGFLAHFILSEFFRRYSNGEKSARALLILNHHSKAHWTSIGSKIGVNVSSLEETGTVVVVDLIKETYQALKSSQAVEDNCSNNPMCLKNLYLRCEKIIQDFGKAGAKRVVVIVEDLTNFLDSDSNNFLDSERELLHFFMKLRALSITESNACTLTLVSLVQSPQMTSDSLELTRFVKTVTNTLSTVTFEVSPLSTGFSAQVTGFLKVVCNPRKVSFEKSPDSAFIKTFHFKLDSNGARATAL